MKKPYWQTVLDEARTEADDNPHIATEDMLRNPKDFSHVHRTHVVERAARGWIFKISKLVFEGMRQWHFSGTLDPAGRPFDVEDMNFLVEAATYLGADLSRVKVVFGHIDDPIHFCWLEEVENGVSEEDTL